MVAQKEMIRYEIWTLAKIITATEKVKTMPRYEAFGLSSFAARIAATLAHESAKSKSMHIKIRDKCELKQIPHPWQYMATKIELNGTIHKDRFG